MIQKIINYSNQNPETIIVALCTIIASIVGSILANWLNTQKDERNERFFEKSIIKSLESEMKTLYEIYGKKFVDTLELLPENQCFTWIYTARYDYFSVYNANSLFIGRIKNEELRGSIIETYVQSKSFLENLIIYGEKFKEFKTEKDYLLKTINNLLTYSLSLKDLEIIINPNIKIVDALNELKINCDSQMLLAIENQKIQIIDKLPDLIYYSQNLKSDFIKLKEKYHKCFLLINEELNNNFFISFKRKLKLNQKSI